MRELVLVFRERCALIRAFVALLLAQPDTVRHSQPQQAIALAVAIVFASMITGVLIGDARHSFAQLSDEQAAEEPARNFLGYSSLDEAFRRT
jgi:hypothetical protein